MFASPLYGGEARNYNGQNLNGKIEWVGLP